MLRALTMLCLGTVMAPSRFSISTQSTPRCPRSQASPSPIGPAPTMITEVLLLSFIPLLVYSEGRPAFGDRHGPGD